MATRSRLKSIFRLGLICLVLAFVADVARGAGARGDNSAAGAMLAEMQSMFGPLGSRSPGTPGNKALADLVAGRFEASGFTPGKADLAGLREKQARQSTDVGAPGVLDLRRVRTVLQ